MNERGDALLETVLIAPVVLLLGLVATEFGVSALRRSWLSESIRSTISLELINAQDGEIFQDGYQMEHLIKEKLKLLPSLDKTKPLDVTVTLVELSQEQEIKLPFLTFEEETILPKKPKAFQVQVRAYSEAVFKSIITLPPLEDTVKHRLRG